MASKKNTSGNKPTKKTVKKTTAKNAVKKNSSKAPAKKVVKKASPKKAVAKKPAAKKSLKSPAKKAAVKSSPKKGIAKASSTTQRSTKTESSSKSSGIAGKTFLFTGTLTGMQRKEAEALVKENGGSILSGVSDKLNYLVVGEDAGSKLEKAKAIKGVKILSEKEFVKMFANKSSPPIQSMPNTNFGSEHTLKVFIRLSGNGIDFRVKVIDNDDQIEYWKNKIEEGEGKELLNHLLNYEKDIEDGIESWHLDYFDNIGDNFQIIGPGYSKRTILNISVYKKNQSESQPANDELLNEISISITDDVLTQGQPLEEDDFYFFKGIGGDGLLDFNQESEYETFLCAISYDSGGYFRHEIDIPFGEGFDLKKIKYHLFEIRGTRYNDNTIVEALSYNGNLLKCKPGYWVTDNNSNDAEMIFRQD